MGKGNILMIESNEKVREGLRIFLESENYVVEEAKDGEEGLQRLNNKTDLVILNMVLPQMSGIKLCEEIRKESYVPILFTKTRAREADKFIALMAGGDDCISDSMNYPELLGRVKALVRRYRIYQGKTEIEDANRRYVQGLDIRVDEEFHQVYVDRKEIELSEIEYHILLLLMKYPGKIFSAQNLYESVWNEPYFYTCSSTVMVHIRKLRVKIEKNPRHPKYITTVWGKGYRFATSATGG